MEQSKALMTLATLVTLLTTATAAGETGWQLRIFAAGHDADLDVMVPAENPEEILVTSESDLGFGASLEYQLGNLLGLEVGYMRARPKIKLIAEDVPGYGNLTLSDSMSTSVIMLDLNLHLTPDSQFFDVYIGAGVASMGYGDLHYVDPEGDPLDLRVSNDVGLSAKAGLGIALGENSRWSAIGGLRYIWTDLEVREATGSANETAAFDFDTFSFSVGIACRF